MKTHLLSALALVMLCLSPFFEVKAQNFVVNCPAEVCAPATVDLTSPSITWGSDQNLTYTYWRDQNATDPLNNPSSVSETNIFYIKASDDDGSWTQILPVGVTIGNNPPLNITCPPPLCQNSIVDLTKTVENFGSDAALSYFFYSDANLTIPIPDPTAVTVKECSVFYLKGVYTCGCNTVVQIPITTIAPPALIIKNPETVCGSINVALSSTIQNMAAGKDITYTYFIDSTLKNPVANPDMVKIAGTYYIVATNQSGCHNIQAVHIKAATPTSLVVVDPTPICGNINVALSTTIQNMAAGNGITYSYFSDSTLKSPVVNADIVKTAGTYFIVATNQSGCQNTQAVHILSATPPNLMVADPAPICGSETINLSSTITNLNSNCRYTFYSDANLQNIISRPDMVTQSGTYYIKAQNSAGCESINKVNVVINLLPYLKTNNPADGTLASADLTSSFFTAGSDAGLVFSYFMDANSTIPIPQPNKITQSGLYYIVATNPKSGCYVKGQVKIILNVNSLFIPSLFTPNGDGVNDTFVIKGIEAYPDNTLEVFNRWGNKVYEANNYGNGLKFWNGSGLLEGTYYYVLKLHTGNSIQTRSGWTMILLKPIH